MLYSDPKRMEFASRLCWNIVYGICLLVLLASCRAQEAEPASPWAAPARQLVQNVITKAGRPSSIAITWQNRSSLSAGQFAQIRRASEAQFKAASVRLLSPDDAVAIIRMDVSEDVQGLLWVAEIKQGTATQYSMLQVPQPAAAPKTSSFPLNLKATTLWSQAEPILDFARPDAQTLVILDVRQLAILNIDAGRWKVKQSFPVTHTRPWPRDVRGLLIASGSNLQAFLPGTKCELALLGSGFGCESSDDPWPLSASVKGFFSPTRNFFTGVLVTGGGAKNVAPFFSAASSGDGQEWLLAGLDGRARVYKNFDQVSRTVNGLGSGVASLDGHCGLGVYALSTQPGESSAGDAMQAITMQGNGQAPASAPLEVSGAVTALWADGRAVIHNGGTNLFEATQITSACQ